MYTQCRGCGEIFIVSVDDLVSSQAKVRCSSCGTVFNSLETLSEYKGRENSNLILHEHDSPPPLLTHEFKVSIVKEKIDNPLKVDTQTLEKELEYGVEGEINEQQNYENEEPDLIEDASLFSVKPDFVADGTEVVNSKKPVFTWLIATFSLMVLLLWQGSAALKKGSLKLPEGQFKQIICAQVNCFSGLIDSNVDKIALVSRTIRQHPGRDNALIITAGIINSDKKIQSFPALEIKMSNLNGKTIAMRRFLPAEYIGEEIRINGMPPNTLIPITLELQSPGKNAVAFEVGFSPTHGAN